MECAVLMADSTQNALVAWMIYYCTSDWFKSQDTHYICTKWLSCRIWYGNTLNMGMVQIYDDVSWDYQARIHQHKNAFHRRKKEQLIGGNISVFMDFIHVFE